MILVKNRVAKLMRYAFVEKKEAGARGKGERGSFQAKCIKSPRRDLPRREEEEGRPLLIPLSPPPLTDNPVNRRKSRKKSVGKDEEGKIREKKLIFGEKFAKNLCGKIGEK